MWSKVYLCFFAIAALCVAVHAAEFEENVTGLERRGSTADALATLMENIEEARKRQGNNDDNEIFEEDEEDVPSGFFTTVTNVGGSSATIVTRSGGPAITLASQGTTTTFGGSTWTIPTTTTRVTSPTSAPTTTTSSSSKTSSGFTTIFTSIDKHQATIVSSIGGPAVTLTSKGITTTFWGSTYTIPAEATKVLAAAASRSNAAGSIQPSTLSTAAVGGAMTILVGMMFGAILVL